MAKETGSIFARYFADEPFVDRYAANSDGAVDIIIPVLYSNEVWRKNLISIYREIPVNRLLLGDAGSKDDTLEVARQFPRLTIFDHSSFKSLGYSVRELIKAVETEWFLYLHSDVYLPEGWFDTMRSHQGEYDWFGCPMRITAALEYPLIDNVRPYAGSQMGRKAAFLAGVDRIDDDYVYRQEDWVFARIVEDGGYRVGKIEDTFHWHQMMPRVYGNAQRARKFKEVRFDVEMTREEELLTAETQLRGTIKYLRPNPYQVRSVRANLEQVRSLGKIEFGEFYRWVAKISPGWLTFLGPREPSANEIQTTPKYRDNPADEHVATPFVEAVVRYMEPSQAFELFEEMNADIAGLKRSVRWNGPAFASWMGKINPAWSPYFSTDMQMWVTGDSGSVEQRSTRVGSAGGRRTVTNFIATTVSSFLLLLGLLPLVLLLWGARAAGKLVDSVLLGSRKSSTQAGQEANRWSLGRVTHLEQDARAALAHRCYLLARAFETLASRVSI